MDHAIGSSRAAAKTVQVLDRAAMRFRPARFELLGRLHRADKPGHLMAGGDQFINNGRLYEARCSSDENPHCIEVAPFFGQLLGMNKLYPVIVMLPF
ncbi:hypothetical protein GCM10023158_19830 [Gluconacetobacter tumulicola]